MLVVLDERLSYRGGRLNRFDCISNDIEKGLDISNYEIKRPLPIGKE